MAVPPICVGRERELDAVRSVIERAQSGTPSLLLVHGEAGIGKTTLVRECAAGLGGNRAHVLMAQCLRFGADVTSYLPLTRALDRWLRSDADELRARLAPRRRVEDLVPALTDTSGHVLLQFGAFLDDLQADRPTVLVVDDLQWADPSSLDVLSYLVAGFVDGQRLCILATYRDTDLGDGHRLHGWLADVLRMPGVEGLHLGRLDVWAIEEILLSGEVGTPDAALAHEVFNRSRGNPYLAVLLIEQRLAGGPFESSASRLVDALASEWHRLSPPARRLTQLLAVAGAPTALPVLREVAANHGVRRQDALAAAQEALAHGVAIETESGAIWFRHPLQAETIAASLHDWESADLHRYLANTWLTAVGVHERDRTTSLALHYVAAGDRANGLIWALRAADQAEAIGAWDEASRHLSTAVSLAAKVSVSQEADERRLTLLERAARACEAAGDDPGAVRHYESALSMVDRATAPRRAAGILLELHILRDLAGLGSTTYLSLAEPREALDILSGLADAPERVQALGQLSFAEAFLGSTGQARAHADLAVRMAEGCDDAAAFVWALGARGQSRWGTDEGVHDSQRAYDRAAQFGDAQLMCRAAIFLSNSFESAGRYAEAADTTAHTYRRLRAEGRLDSAATVGAITAQWSFHLGRWDVVRSVVRDLLSIARSSHSAGMARCVAALLTSHEGRRNAAGLHLRRAQELLSPTAAPIGDPLIDTQIQVHIALGEPIPALQLISTHVAEAMHINPFAADEWVELSSRAALRLSELTADDETRELATQLLHDIEATRGTDPVPFAPAGPHDLIHPALGALHLAQRASFTETEDGVVALWEAACVATDIAGMRYHHARAQHHLARVLLNRRRNRQQAVQSLATARSIASELGARPLINEIDELTAQVHVHLRPDDERSASSRGTALHANPPLTRREKDVVDGLLAGETYAQIGARLFISDKTVSSHVSNILRKTGATTRIELAALARPAVGS